MTKFPGTENVVSFTLLKGFEQMAQIEHTLAASKKKPNKRGRDNSDSDEQSLAKSTTSQKLKSAIKKRVTLPKK